VYRFARFALNAVYASSRLAGANTEGCVKESVVSKDDHIKNALRAAYLKLPLKARRDLLASLIAQKNSTSPVRPESAAKPRHQFGQVDR